MGKIKRFCVILKMILKDFERSSHCQYGKQKWVIKVFLYRSDHRISDDSYITNLLFPVSLVEASKSPSPNLPPD